MGSVVAPVIKITGNSQTFENMIDDMDVDAGRLLSGAISQQQLSLEIAQLIVTIAAGQKAKVRNRAIRNILFLINIKAKRC